jgi:hypothetical protein
MTLCNKLVFYGEELLAPRPSPNLEAVFSIHNLRTHHAVMTRDPSNMEMLLYTKLNLIQSTNSLSFTCIIKDLYKMLYDVIMA